MAKICFICPNQISRTPRLVRNANALATAGHEVIVVYADHLSEFEEADREILVGVNWTAVSVDFHRSLGARLRGYRARLRRKVFSLVAPLIGWSEYVLTRAFGYFGPELAKAAAMTRAEVYFAQQQVSIAAAVRAARATRAHYAVDIEDLLSDSSDEPIEIVKAIEAKYLPKSSIVATMSVAAAERLSQQFNLQNSPIVLHNCAASDEAVNLLTPKARKAGEPLSLYWFGQTIGPHSCADTILRSMAKVPFPIHLTLRGTIVRDGYIQYLRDLTKELGIEKSLSIVPGASPMDMIRLAAEHDICLGTQPSRELFHQLAIGNKVFTGMMAGCAILLTDTIAHRRLLESFPGWALLISHENEELVASALHELASSSTKLDDMKNRAWILARSTFNWEKEGSKLVAAVNNLHRKN
jgi:glycosyltransferase involved in cell wall biosynthesis